MKPCKTFAVILASASLMLSTLAMAHCDALDGPVVRDARIALEKRDPALVLKWVAPNRESEIREAFAKTLAVRALGKDAEQLSDRWFFETLVRVHRAGEGEPFTGLKPAGRTDPGIAAADSTLESGASAAGVRLATKLAEGIEAGVRERFDLALKRKQQADDIEAGREYVSAYVDYIHFVENVHRLAEQGAPHSHTDHASE
jgi:hypothetical protein